MENKYLPFSVTTQPDAVEKYFCKPFEQALLADMESPAQQMANAMQLDEAEMFLKLTLTDDSAAHSILTELFSKSWAANAVRKRVDVCLTITIDDRILVWLMYLTNDSVGEMMMYIYYMQYWASKNSKEHVSWQDWGSSIFPNGHLANSRMHEIWEAQKVMRDKESSGSGLFNLIDYASAATSIMHQTAKVTEL